MIALGLGIAGLLLGLIADDAGGPWLAAIAGVALGVALDVRRKVVDLQATRERLQAVIDEQRPQIHQLQNNVVWLWHEGQRLAARPTADGDVDADVQQPAPAATPSMLQANAVPPPPAPTMPAALPTLTPKVAASGDVGPRVAAVSAADANIRPVPATSSAATAVPVARRPFEPPPRPRQEAGAGGPLNLGKAMREFLFGGNTIVRVGILVLLVGVVLLLKWAADNDLFPIELRMGSVALLAMGLIGFGYRARQARPGFAETLQGGGVAALYLSVFFSYRVYELLPAGLAFALLAAVSVFSCTLAALQDRVALIILGTLGGFSAPVLASSGSDNHVGLFGYYLLLDLAVLGICVAKGWRVVALLGFVCTFGIGTAWGVLKYEPQKLTTTEPFLLAFFLIFAAIPILLRARMGADARDDGGHRALDSSLTFGTPLTVLVLQGALLRGQPMMMAFAVAGFGALYVAAAWALLRTRPRHFRALFESSLVIGAGFGTLAIPYALSDHNLTGAAWALEGAGMYWLGARHGRRLRQWVGALLQVAAGVSVLIGYTADSGFSQGDAVSTPATDHLLGGALLAVSCYLVSWVASKHRDRVGAGWGLVQGLLVWGMCFWLGLGLVALAEQLDASLLPGGYLAFFGGTCLLLEVVSSVLDYGFGRWLALGSFVVTPLCVVWFGLDVDRDPLAHGWSLGWLVSFAAIGVSLRRFVSQGPRWLDYTFVVAVWSLVALVGLVAITACTVRAELAPAWGNAAFVVCISVALLGVTALADSSSWPFGVHEARFRAEVPLTGVLMSLTVVAFQTLDCDGDAGPLETLPLLNPLDLAHLLGLVACIAYFVRARGRLGVTLGAVWYAFASAVGFVWFNGVLARAVHHQTGVGYRLDALWASPQMHWMLSGAWTLLAVAVLFLATRRRWRVVWMTAAGLMAITVAKLFLVDLSRQSTVARIVTFLAVGLALLVVGYLSPLPPRRTEVEA